MKNPLPKWLKYFKNEVFYWIKIVWCKWNCVISLKHVHWIMVKELLSLITAVYLWVCYTNIFLPWKVCSVNLTREQRKDMLSACEFSSVITTDRWPYMLCQKSWVNLTMDEDIQKNQFILAFGAGSALGMHWLHGCCHHTTFLQEV